jgi:signal transduction histidine kinase
MQAHHQLVRPSGVSQLKEYMAHHCAIAQPQESGKPAAHGVDPTQQIEQLKESFLSTISHELRTPIASIKMAVQMLTLALSREGLLTQTGKPSLSQNKIAHYLKILHDECNREINLITDLLDLQRLETTTQPLNLQPIALEPYLNRILRPFQEQAETQQLTLVTEISPDLPSLMSDAQILERVLVELLTNACKYTPASETIRVRLYFTGLDASGEATCVFQVCNSGVQLPADQLIQIFEKFYRIPSHDPHRHAGTGLGLALVKKLVAQLGGTIRATSAEHQTCLTLELPLTATVRLPSLASVSAPAG